MHPIFIDGGVEITKPKGMTDEQCQSIYAVLGVDSDNFPFFITAWQPNKEDIEAINAGRPIFVRVVTTQLSPMELFTTDEKGKFNV